jgi:uncharacterized membrane protein
MRHSREKNSFFKTTGVYLKKKSWKEVEAMKWITTLKNVFKGMGESIYRFPLTVGYLLAVAILNALMIENTEMDFTRLIYTFLVGAMLSVVCQMLHERFVEKRYRSL